MSEGCLSPRTCRRLLQGQAGVLPAPSPSGVAIFISSVVSGKGQRLAALGGRVLPAPPPKSQLDVGTVQLVTLWGHR